MKETFGMSLKTLILRSLASPKNLVLRHFSIPISINRFNFEVTRICNGHCIYCNIWKEKPEDQITVSDVKEGLKPRSLLAEVDRIQITGGEPFLRADIVELCQILKEICPKASFAFETNGLRPDLALKYLLEVREFDPKVLVNVSIDGFHLIDAILRGDKRHYKLAWKTVSLLRREGFHVGVGSVVTRLNIHDISRFHNFCEEKGITHNWYVVSTSEHYYKNVGTLEDVSLTSDNLVSLEKLSRNEPLTSIGRYVGEYFREKKQIMPCFSGFNSFFLASNGNVFPCIHLNRAFGNIKVAPFGALWNSKYAWAIRKSVVQNECHCFTPCEVASWFRANLFPAITRKLRLK